jgi:LemA protein
MQIALLSLIGLLFLFVAWFVMTYNKLIKLRNLYQEGWSGIDVQLKRRSNLIPNLLESVKGYMGHEKELLVKVTEQRAKALAAHSPESKIPAEMALGASLGKLLAIAENYPDLKASQNFLKLQEELSALENEIQMARRYYNGTVRNLNVGIETFPNVIVATIFHFHKAAFFELTDKTQRAVPTVKFN